MAAFAGVAESLLELLGAAFFGVELVELSEDSELAGAGLLTGAEGVVDSVAAEALE